MYAYIIRFIISSESFAKYSHEQYYDTASPLFKLIVTVIIKYKRTHFTSLVVSLFVLMVRSIT